MSYTYIIGSLIIMLIWALIFAHRKDLRERMLIASIIFTVVGIILALAICTIDYWRPPNITGTLIGIEDVMFCFGIGGIFIAAYPYISDKKIVPAADKYSAQKSRRAFWITLAISVVTVNIAFFIFGLNSIHASIIAAFIGTIAMFIFRPDLIRYSLWTGVISTIVAFAIYIILVQLEPTMIRWWFVHNITGITILKIPIEEYVWFFVTGLFLGPLYALWEGSRLLKRKK